MMSELYQIRCDSTTHELEHQDPPDPIVANKCHDWHPDLVWYDPVEPCKHGKYDQHPAQHRMHDSFGIEIKPHEYVCKGAPKLVALLETLAKKK